MIIIDQEDDDMSKYSDEKRSTLPLHSDSFKKHSDHKVKDYILEEGDIQDTEKRGQYNSPPMESPHFLNVNEMSASNPFTPYDSNRENYDLKISTENIKYRKSKNLNNLGLASEFEGHGRQSKKPQTTSVGIQIECQESLLSTAKDKERICSLEQENEDLKAKLEGCKESNVTLKNKYETFCERSTTLEKLLRERECKSF